MNVQRWHWRLAWLVMLAAAAAASVVLLAEGLVLWLAGDTNPEPSTAGRIGGALFVGAVCYLVVPWAYRAAARKQAR